MSRTGGFTITVENEGDKLVATRLNFHSERNSYNIIIFQNWPTVQLTFQIYYNDIACLKQT